MSVQSFYLIVFVFKILKKEETLFVIDYTSICKYINYPYSKNNNHLKIYVRVQFQAE